MPIEIHHGDRISEFKRQFESQFPFLRMEITPLDNHKTLEIIPKKENLTFESKVENDGVVVISNESRFSEIESGFRKNFGLQAKLYRRISNSWIETKHTGDWTLQDQNNQGFGTSKLMDDINDGGN